MSKAIFLIIVAQLGAAVLAAEPASTHQRVDFNRQILPILSDNCFACHGPDAKQRKAGLRFDLQEGAFAKLPSGHRAIVAGQSKDSALAERVSSNDSESVMPPRKSGKQLSKEQIELLKRWIDEGAEWKPHWAFIAPKRSPRPAVKDAKWVRNPIDSFILARLEKEGLAPANEAEKTTLVRRVTFDLTGLPPTLKELDDALNDKSADWFEKVVDRLLASPRYGEHRARYWLDAARYGDTHGLHLDNYREMWPYRDWVIKALNDNMPFNRFIVEQIAGDLLENPTLEQQIATGFNRCHVSTSEGGSIEEECYVRNVVDRVDTTGTVFMGLSVGCCRCHDHKYDPISQKNYYALFAYFNSLDGANLDGNAAIYPPVVRVAGPEQLKEYERLKQRVAEVKKRIAAEVAKVAYDESAEPKTAEIKPRDIIWIDDNLPAGVTTLVDGNQNVAWDFVGKPDHPVHSGNKSLLLKTTGLRQMVLQNANPGLKVGTGDKLFAWVYLDPRSPPKEIMLQWHTSNWLHRAYWGDNKIDWGRDNSSERFKAGPLPGLGKWVRIEVEAAKVGIAPGTVINGWACTQFDGAVYWDAAGIHTQTPQGPQSFDSYSAWLKVQRNAKGGGLPKPISDLVRKPDAKLTSAQSKELRDYFIAHAYSKTRTQFEPLTKQLKEVEADMDKLDKTLPVTMVFKEMAQPKPSYILKRGEYHLKGEKVERDTPAFLPPLPDNAPNNRLGFANWLVSPEHPLTARVAVNRLWLQVFGTGIVKTAEDFGAQGEPPVHPELLDWLAVEFRESGWDVKKMIKLFVMSATYRQSAKLTPEKLLKDRDNRLLSRGPRFRLDAESLRDQALYMSGLLVEKIGGPGVKPPQPSGLWEAVGYLTSNTRNFVADTGHEKVHRRSLYTFWKRTAPPPQMSIIDAPSREACMVRRERTNTPLQALLLMNDTQYVECSRVLAERVLREAGDKPEARLTAMFRIATSRMPDQPEISELLNLLKEQRDVYDRDPEAAKKLIAVGETKADAKWNTSELAAYTVVANLVLNLDEVLNK